MKHRDTTWFEGKLHECSEMKRLACMARKMLRNYVGENEDEGLQRTENTIQSHYLQANWLTIRIENVEARD